MAGSGPKDDGSNPDFEWIYGSQRPPGGQRPATGPGSGPRPSDRPEPTVMLPQQPRPGADPAPPPARTAPSSYPPADGGGSRRSGWRRPGRWVKVVLALLALWLVYLVAVPIYAWSQVDKVAFEPDGERPDEQPGTTYLIVGSDSRGDLSKAEQRELGTGGDAGNARTDTIMLLHTGSGPDVLVSVPRDTLVDVPGEGTQKVNSAFAIGGPTLLTQTLEGATGLRVDHYVEIGFGGFVDVVDAVGGIEICPKTAINDPKAKLKIEKGCQEADGATALGYARTRHTSFQGSNDDFARVRRQREVIAAIGDEAVSPWTVLNPVRYWRLANAAPGAIAVGEGMGPFDAVQFARAMAASTAGDGVSCTLPVTYEAVSSGYSDVVIDTERADQLFDILAEDRSDDLTKKICNQKGL